MLTFVKMLPFTDWAVMIIRIHMWTTLSSLRRSFASPIYVILTLGQLPLSHFTDGKTELREVKSLVKVAQQVSEGARNETLTSDSEHVFSLFHVVTSTASTSLIHYKTSKQTEISPL